MKNPDLVDYYLNLGHELMKNENVQLKQLTK